MKKAVTKMRRLFFGLIRQAYSTGKPHAEISDDTVKVEHQKKSHGGFSPPEEQEFRKTGPNAATTVSTVF